MTEQNEKQSIEEMYKDVYEDINHNSVIDLINGGFIGINTDGLTRELYDDGYRKQSEGEWEWFEEWNPSTTEHPRECYECGWRCSKCKEALADMVGGYWDDPEEKPNLNFCPNCGAHMKGGSK